MELPQLVQCSTPTHLCAAQHAPVRTPPCASTAQRAPVRFYSAARPGALVQCSTPPCAFAVRHAHVRSRLATPRPCLGGGIPFRVGVGFFMYMLLLNYFNIET